jgi:large subunit ribosomal protein L17
MRHGVYGRKFNRDTNSRKALLSGLAKSLIQYEQIKTTLPKAKDIRPIVEKLVTLGKRNTLHARRQLISALGSNELATKVLNILSTRYKDRQGGYTRIVKAGFRHGDMAPMAFIEFLDRDPSAKPKKPVEEASESTPENQ